MSIIFVYNQHEGCDSMFRVKKGEETVNKTFRFPETLVDKMADIAQREGVSLNNFVIQCCEYAIEHIQPSDDEVEGI